jgi:hypothetical protein
MATTDAVALLGDTLVAVLRDGLAGLVTPANVTLATPDDFKSFSPHQPAVTVFLYQVGIAGELRNAARRSGPGGIALQPPLPLEVRFLITPWTQQTRDAYRIIGAIALQLYENAVLNFGQLVGIGWAPDDTVELILESLPVEEHYDIWEPTEIPYRLSLTYLARIIGIDPTRASGGAPVVRADFVQQP